MALGIGMRVKRIAPKVFNIPLGSTGTVAAYPSNHLPHEPFAIDISWDNPVLRGYAVDARTLAPLTDPRAESFIEDMQRFAKLAEREKERMV